MSVIRNPKGTNQHRECPPADDGHLEVLLRQYQLENVSNNEELSRRLREEHGIRISASTIKRRKRDLGILGPRQAARQLPRGQQRQMVLDQMADDPRRNRGPRTVQEGVSYKTGIRLPRSLIEDIMRTEDPGGFDHRQPGKRHIERTPLVSLGPNHEWSADGHDKLAGIGFPIWGVRDKFSGKWLKLWVIPDNRLKDATVILFLKLVLELGGIPFQMTTDKGSETVVIFGIQTSLREMFGDVPVEEIPAHVFLKSIRNITIERGWFRLRLDWGDNAKEFFLRGEALGIYNKMNPKHYNLVQWLWPKLIQQELDEFTRRQNTHKTRFDKEKILPSGCTPNEAYNNPQRFHAQDCLVPVDREIIEALIEEKGGDDIIQFVEADFAARCEQVYGNLEVENLTFHNVWDVFESMLPNVYITN